MVLPYFTTKVIQGRETVDAALLNYSSVAIIINTFIRVALPELYLSCN